MTGWSKPANQDNRKGGCGASAFLLLYFHFFARVSELFPVLGLRYAAVFNIFNSFQYDE